ncbi:DUF4271 domain-containing protein [Sediminibacterium sp.]|uniref:DUF4271 domain-containing protein n=1 Tax=Sediminibacterium sp. TaxID=1917865 RepID=UPI003F713EE3
MRTRILLILFFSIGWILVSAKQDSSFLPSHPYLPIQKQAIYMVVDYHHKESKDALFYTLVVLVFLLGFIKTAFPKYFQNLFKLFFQTSLRQKQTKEQLAQDSFASLLINLLFLLTAGLYITQLIQYYNWSSLNFWLLYAYVTIILTMIYLGKYLFISFAGWVFNNSSSASSYLFLVAVVNRIMGVVLLPLTILMAFASVELGAIVATISFGVVTLLFIYRYIVSFGLLRSDLQLNPFHFFLYLCAVEILPMALIYKLLVENMG